MTEEVRFRAATFTNSRSCVCIDCFTKVCGLVML